MNTFKKYFVYYPLFWSGYFYFLLSSKTPKLSYYSFRQLFCLTNGKLNDFMVSMSTKFRPKYELEKVNGILGSLTTADVENISDQIKRDGFYVFDVKLPSEIRDDLMTFSLKTPAKVVPKPKQPGDKFVYDRKNLLGTRYQFDEADLMANHNIQDIVADETLIAVAQEYFGTKPLNDLVTMWWSTAFSKEASSEAAQLYHFDMDRIKFLKFFIYLTDVTSSTGPHCYVRNSHKGLPEKLLHDGRVGDEEVYNFYKKEDVLELTGTRGTILAVDTRGLHKGKPLLEGERLLFQLEFATNFFGQDYNKLVLKNLSNKLSGSFEKYAFVYNRFSRVDSSKAI
jgi:Phytanoyl-CoA dioxygenase (PhyH)